MLEEYIKQEYIKLNVECSTWEESIQKAGQILLENEIVTNQYIEESIRSAKQLGGSYIVITKGVAIPHVTSHVGVEKNGVSIITLKNPIEFGNKENDPVKIVFMLATLDMESHINVLSKISNLLSQSEFFEILKNSKDTKSIIKYINENN